MYGGFRYDVRIEAIAQINGVDVITAFQTD